MASFRFLHCADLHIDSPLRGLEADPDAPAGRIRTATRDAFIALVDYAISREIDFVLAAGDLYDGDWQDWRTGQFLVREVGRLSRNGIPFIAISGNHDARSVITRQLRLPEPAHQMKATKAETWLLPDLDVAIHGQSFATPAVLEDLTKNYPPPRPGSFNIGLLHTNVNGQPGHENYAPSNLIDLRNHGYAYWALGHVHSRAILSDDPWIVYPGNLQGRHVREIGPRGAVLVTVRDGRVSERPTFVPFDTVRWDQVRVDLTGVAEEDAALALVRRTLTEALNAADGRLLAARIVLTGATAAFATLARDIGATREKSRAEALALAGPEHIWIESVAVNLAPPRSRGDLPDLLASTIGRLDAADLGPSTKRYCLDLLDRASGLRDSLGPDNLAVLAATNDELPPDLLERARNLLLARLAQD
jgi:DNA repair protein SbcD/Mre11